jgi:hypothetical protein
MFLLKDLVEANVCGKAYLRAGIQEGVTVLPGIGTASFG